MDRTVLHLVKGAVLLLGLSSSLCGYSENPNSAETIGKETMRKKAVQTIYLDGPDPSSLTLELL